MFTYYIIPEILVSTKCQHIITSLSHLIEKKSRCTRIIVDAVSWTDGSEFIPHPGRSYSECLFCSTKCILRQLLPMRMPSSFGRLLKIRRVFFWSSSTVLSLDRLDCILQFLYRDVELSLSGDFFGLVDGVSVIHGWCSFGGSVIHGWCRFGGCFIQTEMTGHTHTKGESPTLNFFLV